MVWVGGLRVQTVGFGAWVLGFLLLLSVEHGVCKVA